MCRYADFRCADVDKTSAHFLCAKNFNPLTIKLPKMMIGMLIN